MNNENSNPPANEPNQNIPEQTPETDSSSSQTPVTPPAPEKQPITPQQIAASENIVREPIARVKSAPAVQEPATMDRRSFINWLAVGWVAFAAIVGGYASMFLRFLFPNVLFEPKQSFRAGVPEDYPIGEVSEKWKEKYAVWIVRDSEKIYALSTVCTHLGCTPNWLGNENKFKCPCHGSGFYKTGINFEGPAPRPLERFKIALTDDGQILVDKTKKFQQEKGEWNDPDSYLAV